MKIRLSVENISIIAEATDVAYAQDQGILDIYTPCFHYWAEMPIEDALRIMDSLEKGTINISGVPFEKTRFRA